MADLNLNVIKAEDNKSAVVQFDKDSFDNFIGAELAKVQTELLAKAGEYVNEVTTKGYSKAGELFAEEEEMSTVDIEAPIFGEGDRFQAHIRREDIDEVAKDDYVPSIKITQSITSADAVRGGIKTMASVYQDILAKKNS